MIYARRKLDTREEVEVESLEKAKKMAIKDWATGSYLPLHVSDDSGHQVLPHAELRKYLLEQTGIGKWEPQW